MSQIAEYTFHTFTKYNHYYAFRRLFFRDFRKNIKIEQFSQRTCRPRLMFAASQTSSVFTLLMLTLEHFHADNSLSDLPPWLSCLAISGRGAVKAWLAIRQSMGSSPTPAGMSSQVSA